MQPKRLKGPRANMIRQVPITHVPEGLNQLGSMTTPLWIMIFLGKDAPTRFRPGDFWSQVNTLSSLSLVSATYEQYLWCHSPLFLLQGTITSWYADSLRGAFSLHFRELAWRPSLDRVQGRNSVQEDAINIVSYLRGSQTFPCWDPPNSINFWLGSPFEKPLTMLQNM